MTTKKENLLSVGDVSEQADISRQRVLQVIEAGDLKADKVGRNYVVRQSDFDVWFSSRREAGRPSKKTGTK
jgi:excisionase family DNA binding protein